MQNLLDTLTAIDNAIFQNIQALSSSHKCGQLVACEILLQSLDRLKEARLIILHKIGN